MADNKAGSKYGYSVMLISIFYQIFFSNGMFLELIYTEDKPWGIVVLFCFMYINPSFHFANVIVNIIFKAGNHFRTQTMMWEKGETYYWSDFTAKQKGSLFGRAYDKPSPFESISAIGYCTAGFLVMVWFFDNMVASNRGFSRNPITVCVKGLFNLVFFCCKKEEATLAKESETNANPLDDKSEQIWRNIVTVKDEKSLSGIVMKNMSKSYKWACSRGKDSRNDWALKQVDLEIRRGELLGLLGPNGAGKTTMIGIISGILEQTNGDFFSNGLNSNSHREDIRKFTNVCPQFDILWGELTVKHHIEMVCKIKGVTSKDIPSLAKTILSIVNLSHTMNDRISSLSGGMKRRISIALATIGNPTILIFDEPTTGLDPENRRIIWRFINKLKESNRTILLTTHLLEEVVLP